ncbi:GNAT family N-acetyltransferase [Fulvivirgaceae bacterium BMA10]|uniref:GNAT family N-acetyltransferase n=1 Tax=Splendidivirga corallicola TaxID=3051826 RepID=A0ABT8KP32_9BACT|nr:GNAT family N-acetyltransferase [Fulvivirgaceae bacterium BMA10]
MSTAQTNVSIHKLGEQDLERFMEMIRLFEDVFEMKNFSMPSTEHLQRLLSKKDFFVFIAVLENKVVGGMTVYVLEQYYAEKPLAYIYDLAVATKHQRQGIGKKLIDKVNHYCREGGFEEVFVQTDKVDDYAVDFYRSTRPTEEEEVVHFYYTLDKNK